MGEPGVVVGFDGSATSTRAIEWAAQEAKMRRVPLTVAHVRDMAVPVQPAAPYCAAQAQPDATRTLARGVALASRAVAGLHIVQRLLTGPAATALLRASQDAEMLVAGTRGTGNWSWPGLGRVSSQLAAGASCPLLLVPDSGIWHDGPVVVGIDGSMSSRRAAGFAFTEAHLRGAPVLAVRCWRKPRESAAAGSTTSRRAGATAVEADAPDIAGMRGLAEELIKLATGPWRRTYPDVPFSASLQTRPPARALREAADAAPLLVIGSAGDDGMPSLALGQVAREVLLNAAHPVAVVR